MRLKEETFPELNIVLSEDKLYKSLLEFKA